MIPTIQQRREGILSLAYRQGHVSIRQLAEHLNVSEATVRRDLHNLAAEGLLELSRGGAAVARNSDYSFLSKSMRNIEAKRVIAQLAANLIQDGDQIFIGSGTTCFGMAAYLRGRKGLSVIVNSVRTALELQTPGIDVLLLGGQYRPERMDTIGPLASETIERLRGYRAFLGTDGISQDFGLTSIDIESAHLLRLAARNARECILLADSSKFDRPALYKIIDLQMLSTVITEKKPDSNWMDFFERHQIHVLYPKST
jgi:DeoR family fructose operon transcriptional repressor